MNDAPKVINIFLGGGVKLLEGNGSWVGYRRSVVDSVVSDLNAKYNVTQKMFVLQTFADITRNVSKNRKQDEYNKYINTMADVAIFIFDGSIGGGTREEIEKAYNSYCTSQHPIIFIYGTNLLDESPTVKYLNQISEYYHHFHSVENLKGQITKDLLLCFPSILASIDHNHSDKPQPFKYIEKYDHNDEESIRKAAISGNPEAQCDLGDIAYKKNKYAEAINWYRKSAEQGLAVAQNNLGFMYQKGCGTTKDYAEAVRWYRESAEQGYATAQNNLGFMYQHGRGVTQNYEKAFMWYQKSAKQEHSLGLNNLGIMYRKGYGVEQDYVEAVKLFRKSSELGCSSGQYNLGYMCLKGYGVPIDYVEAVKWFQKSADQGQSDAQNSLGDMYCHGKGVTLDFTEAVKWYRKSAQQGNKKGQINLGYMYVKGYGVKKNHGEAFKWYRRSAEQNYSIGQYNLGVMYENGLGVPQNNDEAIKWYRKSADQGYEPAINALKNMTKC